MKHLLCVILLVISVSPFPVLAAVDTLYDSTNIEDCIIYDHENCVTEISGENCMRYNGGNVINMGVGNIGATQGKRVLMQIPGWDGTVPDSARLEIYCYVESDATDRKLFAYPLTTLFYEGTEVSYNKGDYPDPDSGATWNHAWLDVGDDDSLNWTTAGGDYTTSVACTTTITGTGQYFGFGGFERILNYWDSTGNNYGIVLINENAFPANTSSKVIKSSESGSGYHPLLLLFTADSLAVVRRRGVIKSLFNTN